MSYNGSGTFQINTSGQPVVTGTSISSTVFNALTADLATGLSTAITKDGQTSTTARIPFALGINSTLVTDATNTTSGSIITAGGVGIAKALYVGTTANVAGAVTLGGVATFSAQPIFSSLTASSAVATDASKGLVSVTNTGTGNNVLATAPTIASLNLTTALTIASASGTAGQALTSGGSGNAPTWSTIAATPGGSTTQVQYNNAGAFAGSANLVFDGTNLTSLGTVTGTKFIPTGSSATGNGIYLPAANSVGLSTNGGERFRMDSTGNAFFSGNYTVSYPGNGNTTTGIFLESSGQLSVSRDNTAAGSFNRNSTDGVLINLRRQGTASGDISVTTTTVAYNSYSDYRLKENISPMTGALAKVALLKPVTYKWKSNGSDGQGFIAHELQAVVPDSVTGEKDGTQMLPYEITPAVNATYDEDGNELTPLVEAIMGEREVPQYQGIDTSFLVATLTAAIQEQQALITQLTARITALEGAA
jgi:hypothetical protein